MKLFQTKPVATLIAESVSGEHLMKRQLGPLHLISLGIGAVVGAGIFVLAGTAAAKYAGPAIVLSFVISGFGCLLAGLCYAEFATMIPVAGSAYTYTYATMGEFLAWVIGWDLILEYLFSGAAVAVSWSASIQALLQEFGVVLPAVVGGTPFALEQGHLVATGAVINLPAVFLVAVLTVVLVLGIRESAVFNDTMVFIKVGVLLALVIYGAWWLWGHPAVAAQNWHPFIPPNTGRFGEFGWSGVCTGAAVIFFAYVGFDNVSCAAQETRHPQRDMPIGLLGGVAICGFLFIAVSLVLTGMVNYTRLNVDAPFIYALQQVGAPAVLRFSVEIATIAGLTSAALRMLVATGPENIPRLRDVHVDGTTVAISLVDDRGAVEWMRDWPKRKTSPWALNGLAISLRRLHRREEALGVSRRALQLPADHITPCHRAWVAIEAALDADLAEAESLLEGLESPSESKAFYDALGLLARAAIVMRRSGGAAFDEAKRLVKQADGLAGRNNRDTAPLRRRIVDLLVRERGGVAAWLWRFLDTG